MRWSVPPLALALACATAPPAAPPAPASGKPVLRLVELRRAKCLLVTPFENASDAPLASEAATGAVVSAVDPMRAKVFPIPDLRALFRDTPLELPEGISPSLALELGGLLGADAALYGSVEGRSRGANGALIVTVRVALVSERDVAFATTVEARPSPTESVEGAVRRATLEAMRPVLTRIGSLGRKACFDRERTSRLRAAALADARGGGAVRPPAVAPRLRDAGDAAPAPRSGPATGPTQVGGSAGPSAAAPKVVAARAGPPKSVRQAQWARKLAGNRRLLVEDVVFRARTAELARDGGISDLAAALADVPELKVRIEAFVDATSDPRSDARLSIAMAQAAARRLAALGVPKDRLTTAGRGGESPILPNFTARGRAANRRIEVVAVK